MNILTLSPIIIIILAIIFFLITKKIFKALGFLLLLSLVIFFVGAIFTYIDVQDFKENFFQEEKLFLLKENENYIAGFVLADPETGEIGIFLDNEDINQLRQMSKRQILGDNYKLLIFEESAFDNVRNINFNNKLLSKQETFNLINSENTMKDAANIIFEQPGLSEEVVREELSKQGIDDESKLRSILFASLIRSATEDEEMFIINKIKSADLEVYPQTVLFTAIKFMPDLLFTAFQKGKDLTEVIA